MTYFWLIILGIVLGLCIAAWGIDLTLTRNIKIHRSGKMLPKHIQEEKEQLMRMHPDVSHLIERAFDAGALAAKKLADEQLVNTIDVCWANPFEHTRKLLCFEAQKGWHESWNPTPEPQQKTFDQLTTAGDH